MFLREINKSVRSLYIGKNFTGLEPLGLTLEFRYIDSHNAAMTSQS